ncbi:MAG TPA: hypothetical protein DCK76_07730 [Desulfotomaculum sp.]|nr:hypothetical protein [Desulfotomaculum sp.]HBY04445.1 hypothetical protein [Desulfotomaculum sp.]
MLNCTTLLRRVGRIRKESKPALSHCLILNAAAQTAIKKYLPIMNYELLKIYLYKKRSLFFFVEKIYN